MDQYIVSARKYRPTTFDDVVGQKHIADTLRNAIKSGHLAQAFLFSGPRGVGKTTCARILAKTINCFNRTEHIEACEKCESCESFNDGHSLNIYELDAASNNSVDDIRLLIDQVRFAPQLGTKKVYIIDEVHMLSAQAFNAFLKTLEEPPSHAIFILATTEKHKIIPTILSRCQVFDFNRIELNDMVRRLEEIAVKEGVKAENDALHLIAQKSEGSLRDALSMFDQMVAYSGENLTYNDVIENLSILSSDYFFNLTEFLVNRDTSASLKLFNEVLFKGFDGHHFLLGLAEHMRNLLVAQDHSTIELITAGPQIKEKYAKQTLSVSAGFLIKGLNLISQADLSYKAAKNQRLLVELCLINLANLSPAGASTEPSANQAVDNKKKLPEPASVVKVDQPTSERPEKKEVQDVSPPRPAENPVKEKVIEAAAPEKTLEAGPEAEIEVERPESPAKKEVISEVKTEAPKVEKVESEVVAAKPAAKTTGKRSFHDTITSDSFSISTFTAKEEKQEIEVDEEGAIVRFTEAVSADKLAESWKNMLDHFDKRGKLSLFATLSKYQPKLVDESHIEITYDNKSQAEALTTEKASILEHLRKDLKNDLLQLRLTISDNPHQRAYTPSEKLEKMIEKNPSINSLKDKLDLEIN